MSGTYPQAAKFAIAEETQTLIDIATRFRVAIQSDTSGLGPIGMSAVFPKGWCTDASYLLGAYLADSGVVGFKLVSGSRGSHEDRTWHTHSWLQRGNCVVDITADQFPDAPPNAFVADPSAWHLCFRADLPGESDFRKLNPLEFHWHYQIYAGIVEAIRPQIYRPSLS
jgi:hypothetical protein